MPYYPRFIESANRWLAEHPEVHVTPEQLAEADVDLYQINQSYYDNKLLVENNLTTRSIEEIKFEHKLRLQVLFDDYFGDGAFYERHEIYKLEE